MGENFIDLLNLIGTIGGVLVALIFAWWQLSESRKANRIQRTIAFHEALTTGEVGAARDRLATLMWAVGESLEPGACYRPTFAELLGENYSRGTRGVGRTLLDTYPPNIAEASATTPLQDLYRLLWTFERIDAAAQNGLVEKKLVSELLDHHVVWWDALADNITDDDTRHRRSLRRLANSAHSQNAGLRAWAARDFVLTDSLKNGAHSRDARLLAIKRTLTRWLK